MTKKQETATFAAGCFWGVEELFRTTPGVIKTIVGYSGGNTTNPTYEQVCTGKTNHAESVEIIFDPSKVNYEQLLRLFFENHNPTTKDRQGPDHGTQYRSVIFYHDEEQKRKAETFIKRLKEEKRFKHPIITQIISAQPFYPAEEYHQQYLAKRGQRNCHI